MAAPTRIWTVGHGNRTLDEFLALLKEAQIETLVDVRRWPTSRLEHFRRDALAAALGKEGITYRHLRALGGYRGDYVAYTATRAFAEGLKTLLAVAERAPTAVMCAETLFFRCHRRFVADVLVRRGVRVIHILGPNRTEDHRPGPRDDG